MLSSIFVIAAITKKRLIYMKVYAASINPVLTQSNFHETLSIMHATLTFAVVAVALILVLSYGKSLCNSHWVKEHERYLS